MVRRALGLLLVFLVVVLPASSPAVGPPVTTERLIDALAETNDGWACKTQKDIDTFLLWQARGARGDIGREALRELVRRGPRVAPLLVAHLGDTRKTRFVARGAGAFTGKMCPNRDADHNPRTQGPRLEDNSPLKGFTQVKGGFYPLDEHIVTVGDLCYEALGEIVNREFYTARYVGYGKVGSVFGSSTTHFPGLRRQVAHDWKGLTPSRHAASLVNDFMKPDNAERRIGAAQRLAFYHPSYLEPLVLGFLAQPTWSARKTGKFVKEKLYKAKDIESALEHLAAFVKDHGEEARGGVERQLFDDLQQLEYDEERAREDRDDPPKPEGRFGPREILPGLYGRSKKVRHADGPKWPGPVSDGDRSEFIAKGLLFDDSDKIDRAVLGLLRGAGEDDDLALACIARLVGRGYDADVERRCKARLKVLPREKQSPYNKALERLGHTRLHVSAERGLPERVRELLGKGASPVAQARNGKTALHLAVERGHLDTLHVLAATRRGLDLEDAKGHTPVDMALDRRNDEAVRTLAEFGCAINDIRVAALADRADRAEALLRAKPALANLPARDRRTPLHLAARWGNVRTMVVLLRHGAKLEAKAWYEGTPLLVAVWAGRLEAARFLLANKANVRATNYQGPVQAAAENGDLAMVKLLLAHGGDVNERGESPAPLHIAVQKNNEALAALLIANRARVNILDGEGATPLHRAAEAGRPGLVRLLLRHRADVKWLMRTNAYQPLHLAANGSAAVCNALLRAGAPVNQTGAGTGCLRSTSPPRPGAATLCVFC